MSASITGFILLTVVGATPMQAEVSGRIYETLQECASQMMLLDAFETGNKRQCYYVEARPVNIKVIETK